MAAWATRGKWRLNLIEFTGERLVPGEVDQDLLNEHLARYAFAARLARGKRVLDVACGVGYGSAALACVADSVTGVDVSSEAVEAARATYTQPNLTFETAPAQALPFDDASFDLVVAYEVIEHLDDWEKLLAEARRVLAPGGQFVVSTPNKEFYAEARRLDGPNPFHLHEFTYREFRAALSTHFPSVTMFLQNHVSTIGFQPLDASHAVAAELAPGQPAPDPESSHFFLAVCALRAQTGAPLYLYLPTSANLLRERERHIVKLEGELASKDAWLDELKQRHSALEAEHEKTLADVAQKAQWAMDVQREIDQARVNLDEQNREYTQTVASYEAKITELEAELVARTERVAQVEREWETRMKERNDEIVKCLDLLHAAEKTIEERTLWAQDLDRRLEAAGQKLNAAQSSRWLKLGRKIGLGPDLGD
jgi:SAM-dependent methyltransferase